MDDRRFDSLTKAFASSANRRSLLKGLLGLGGATVVGGAAFGAGAGAARRQTPTPRPPSCPGKQIPQNGQCVCPPAVPEECGPDCCTGTSVPAPHPAHSECCDNACCFGTCYGEELCCRTNNQAGGLPPAHKFCGGTCVDVAGAGNCCDDGDCGDPCQICNQENHICVDRCEAQTQVCCTEQAGPGVCVTGTCCPGAPCPNTGETCCAIDGRAADCLDIECCHDSDCPRIDACTTRTCQSGNCVNADINCDDGNICTDDFCDPVRGCVHEAVSCDDGNACTVDSCDPIIGCVNIAVDCNDHNACTIDSCDPDRGCVSIAVNCDDGNICTYDFCDPVRGCIHEAVDCNDNNACTVDSCDPNLGCVYTAINCDDGNACTVDTCDPVQGCVHTPVVCDENNACRTNGSCDPQRGCVYTTTNCNDGNACTVDTCDPVLGCLHTLVDCNDNNLCTTEYCDPQRGCVYTVIDCNDGNACTEDWCDPSVGCKHTPINCDDGNICTTNECNPASGCVHNPINCDDGNACTIDTCAPNVGCMHTPVDCSGSNDPANCLVGVCSNGICVTQSTCSSGTVCCGDGTCSASCGGGGCFVGETRIAMADGTSKPVANIVAGDLVLGDDGQINTVFGIDRLTLDNRLLYGLNGSMPFVTASHPFMTDDGWRAIDPANSYLDHRLPAVGQLAVGDRLVLLAGALAPIGACQSATCAGFSGIRTDAIALTSIEGAALPASTPLYNLRLDGNHTYFANELLVHNKLFFQSESPGDGSVPGVVGF